MFNSFYYCHVINVLFLKLVSLNCILLLGGSVVVFFMAYYLLKPGVPFQCYETALFEMRKLAI